MNEYDIRNKTEQERIADLYDTHGLSPADDSAMGLNKMYRLFNEMKSDEQEETQ